MTKFYVHWKEKDGTLHFRDFICLRDASNYERDLRFEGMTILRLKDAIVDKFAELCFLIGDTATLLYEQKPLNNTTGGCKDE